MRTVLRSGCIDYGVTRIMGILNVTPDSFHDGGRRLDDAVEHAIRMAGGGADVIDVGGQSTRPGFVPVHVEEEMRRVVPVIEEIADISSVPISVDTFNPSVAAAALDAGAVVVNAVGGASEEMMKIVADRGAALIITHVPAHIASVHGTVMEGDVIEQILTFFRRKTEAAADAGIANDRIVLDPGIGFGKSSAQNLDILRNTDRFCGKFPVMVGASMKRFLADAFPGMTKEDASIEAAKIAVSKGASMVRVHDVKRTCDALRRRP